MSSMSSDSYKIVLITYLLEKAFIPPLSNLEKVLCSISYNIYSIEGCFEELSTKDTCNGIKKYRILHKQKIKVIERIIRLFYLNLRMSIRLIKISKNVDICIMFIGQYEFIPLLTAKLLRKKVIWVLPSYFPHMIKYDSSVSSLTKIYIRLQKISFYLSDNIILHSKNLIEEWNMSKYKDKILFAHEYFIDFNKFRIIVRYDSRDDIIGFIGRLSEEKGVMNFVKSIPLILNEEPKKKFLIIGDGILKQEIIKYINENKLNDNVKLLSWVKSDKIPIYLNRFKLLVIPSYTESGPIVALEAMACGTPILISKVGQIQNEIQDKNNGFILENNSPEKIAEKIKEINSYNNMSGIINNSNNLVKSFFNYDAAVKLWFKVLERNNK